MLSDWPGCLCTDLASLSFCDCTEARFARLLRCAVLWLHALSALLRDEFKLSCHTGYLRCDPWPRAFRPTCRAATSERGKQLILAVRGAQQLRRHRRGFEAFKPVYAFVLIRSPGSSARLKLECVFGNKVRR